LNNLKNRKTITNAVFVAYAAVLIAVAVIAGLVGFYRTMTPQNESNMLQSNNIMLRLEKNAVQNGVCFVANAGAGNDDPTLSPSSIPFADYVVTASAGPGGAIDPSGDLFAYPGVGFTFTITADSGYKISDVTVDGVSKGAISTYSFDDVQASHQIVASFSPTASFSVEFFALASVTVIILIVLVAVLVMKRNRCSRPLRSPPK
jgi:hypothetical protein